MSYELKEKILITKDFISDIITKSWGEAEALQQQITNIDTSDFLGAELVKVLKNMNTNYYVLIGCLETLLDNENIPVVNSKPVDNIDKLEDTIEKTSEDFIEAEVPQEIKTENSDDFEPFEYFVDFDEPSGIPLSDKDLYGN